MSPTALVALGSAAAEVLVGLCMLWKRPGRIDARCAAHAAAGGLSDLDGRRLYVSRGVGMERGWAPPLRLFCRPEISLLVFERDG